MRVQNKLASRILAYFLAVAMVITLAPVLNAYAALPTSDAATSLANGNIARASTCVAEASYANTTNGAAATQTARIKDGALGVGSGTSWNSWNTTTFPITVTYTWSQPYLIDSTRVMWWYDGTGAGSGVTLPGNVVLQYNAGTAGTPIWTPVSDMKNAAGTSVATVPNQGGGTNGTNRIWNGVTFEPVVTAQLRLSISKGIGTGVGIGEWEVMGEEAPSALYSAVITGSSEMFSGDDSEYTAVITSSDLTDVAYKWELDESGNAAIVGADDAKTVNVRGVSGGDATLTLTATHDSGVKTAVTSKAIKVIETKLTSVSIAGNPRLLEAQELDYTASYYTPNLTGVTYEWSIDSEDAKIVGSNTDATVKLQGVNDGRVKLTVKATHATSAEPVEGTFDVDVIAVKAQTYVTNTAAGKAPILPKRVVMKNLLFDTPTAHTGTGAGGTGYDFGEEFNDSLIAVKSWDAVDPALYAADKVGTTFTVNGIVEYDGAQYTAKTEVTVKEAMAAPETNHSVTSENVTFDDSFWKPKQTVNATSSFDAAFTQLAGTGSSWDEEHNFVNAKARLEQVRAGNMNPDMGVFKGYVFADSDIYKTLEAVSYNLAAVWDDPAMATRKVELQDKLDYWIDLIESIQYADGYVNSAFANRTTVNAGGSGTGNWRWRYMDRHEMYNIGHFLESVVAYTRYREGVGLPDYRLYEVGKRAADHIAEYFGPGGKRIEVPGHEEIELGLMKMAILVEEYEGSGTGDVYRATAKQLVDRRGVRGGANARQSGYNGGAYSQDATAFVNETKAVGHAVRAMYFYTGVTDVATWLNDSNKTAATSYLNVLDKIWENATERNTYITGGIGSAQPGASSEGFGADYALSNTQSYCEICAAIAMSNWNQRLNLVHEDAKYVDSYEKSLFNGSLVGVNLAGGRFYYSTPIERTSTGSARHAWESVACCEPNILRTIANLGGYLYTVKQDSLYVNMYAGSTADVNVEGTNVAIEQKTEYPWDGVIAMTVTPEADKAFAMNIRIPGWVKAQKNQQVVIKVDGVSVDATPDEKGYVLISRTWPAAGTLVDIDIPMEVRMTEPDNNVNNIGTATHSNRNRVAIERGPIVYCLEDAGTGTSTSNTFNATQVVYPRSMELTPAWRPDLLRGVVTLTGTALFNGEAREVTLTPYYAWNNRGVDPTNLGNGSTNSSGRMVVWANATDAKVEIRGTKNIISTSEETTLTAVPRINFSAGADAMPDAYKWSIVSGPGSLVGTPTFEQAATSGYEKIGGVLGADGGNASNTLKYFASTAKVKAKSGGTIKVKVEAQKAGGTLYTDTYDITVQGDPATGANTLGLTLLVKNAEKYADFENTTVKTVWDAFAAALAQAKAIIATPDSYNSDDVDEAETALIDAMDALGDNQVYTDMLAVYVEMAEEIMAAADYEAKYTKGYKQALESALDAAKDLLVSRISQDAVYDAEDALLAAIGDEDQYQKGDAAPLANLASLVNTYLKAGDWTAESWLNITKALAVADLVLGLAADDNASIAQVAYAEALLQAAIDGLVTAAPPLNFVSLDNAITTAQTIIANEAQYIATSIANLPTAIATAQGVRTTAKTQAEINAAATALAKEIAKARKKANLSNLESLLGNVTGLNLTQYTQSSVTQLAVIANEVADLIARKDTIGADAQASIDAAYGRLLAALNALAPLSDASGATDSGTPPGSAGGNAIAPAAAITEATGAASDESATVAEVKTPLANSPVSDDSAVSITDDKAPIASSAEQSDNLLWTLVVVLGALVLCALLYLIITGKRRKNA